MTHREQPTSIKQMEGIECFDGRIEEAAETCCNEAFESR